MKKVILLILDGWGLKDRQTGNAIKQASTPNFDKFWHKYPHAVLQSSGNAVGLPVGQMGTSEANHMVIGAGRIVFQDLVRINKSIKDKSFFENKAIISAFEHVIKHNSTLHIKGLLSTGGVHSHQDHVYALLKAAKLYRLKKVYIHVFTDGRDTLPKSALTYVEKLSQFVDKLGVGKIASISGRFYSMDRDHNWERTDKTFELLTKGRAKKFKSAKKAIKHYYKKGLTDEFLEPSLIEVGMGEEGTISTNDAVVFINFRNDRPRQLVERFLEKGPKNLHYVTLTQYHPDYQVNIAYSQAKIQKTLGEVISQAGLRQLRIAETEKFAHVTFFLNCKREKAFEKEDRIMLDSFSDIKTHDLKPVMRALDIGKEIVEKIKVNTYPVILANLCNADIVGHTGNLKATIKGVEVIDKVIGDIVKTGLLKDFTIIITSDHGNAEEMIDEKTKGKLTAHTLNPVPFILISKSKKKLNTSQAGLFNIAPTILKILNLKKPSEMTGISLI
ncbi:2,3-bisphosphoglycerate-independent phosphoglycerate mutase [Patescibacteria group bacterium]